MEYNSGFPFLDSVVEGYGIEVPRHVYFIAEIGINHNGDVSLAKRLIDLAKAAGCDAVKFQKRTLDIVYSQEVLAQHRESPWGTTQREQKQGLEFGKDEFDEIDAYCKRIGISWFASAWDVPSLDFLKQYSMPYHKIASAMLTHLDFLEAVAKEQKPTFISTGMSNLAEVDAAVEIFKRYNCPFMLMHCVANYPSREEDLNLLCIRELKERYGCPVGYSGHEASVSPSLVAVMVGAQAVERHITLDRSMYGSDQAASLEAPGLFNLVSLLRKAPSLLGTGEKKMVAGEEAIAEKLRYW